MNNQILFIVAISLAVLGCHPVKVSSACQEQMSECLKKCSDGSGFKNEIYISPRDGSAQGADVRTNCEKMCHHCSEQKQKKRKPDDSVPMNTIDYQPTIDPLDNSTKETDTDTPAPPTTEPSS